MDALNKVSKRTLILKAAAKLVRDHGGESLTLDATAKEAGVSKGGLLYYFPNKEQLILGMVEEAAQYFSVDVEQRVEQDLKPTGKWSRAYLESTVYGFEDENDVNAVLSLALLNNSGNLQALQEQYAGWQKNIENDGINPVISTIVRLVADGLWFADMFGLAPPDNHLKQKIVNELLTWTEEG